VGAPAARWAYHLSVDRWGDIASRLAGVPDPVALLTGLFAHAPVGFQIYGADGHSLLVNQAFRDLFGSEPPPEYNVLEDDVVARRGILDLIHRAFAGETVSIPVIWYDPRELEQIEVLEGRRVAVETTIFPLRGGDGQVSHVALAFKDVTAEMERRDAERRLLEESRINETLHRLGAAFARELDEDRLMQLITEEACSLVGAAYGAFFYTVMASEEGAYALHVTSGIDAEAFRSFPMPRATALFGPTFRGEETIRLDDVTRDPRYGRSGPLPAGHPKVTSYLAAPVVARTGAVLGGLFFGHPEPARFTAAHARLITGLSAQAAIAVENARLVRDLRESEERTRLADRRKDEFLAMLSHELRNPLAPIATALELMTMNGEAGAPRERAIIERQVGHLIGLVDDLLDVSRITRGKIQLRREPVELSSVVTSAIEMVSPLLEQRAHSLRVELPSRPLRVYADPIRLAQVLANLLHNAAKYTEPGGRVVIAADEDEDRIRITVSDTGVGIAPEMLPSLFDLFSQGEQSIDRSQGGLGLGLTLVKSLVGLHGGEVEARSDGPGTGSQFEIRLPHLSAEQAARPSSGPPVPGVTAHGRGRRVLVVDDNQDAADLIADALRAAGFVVAVAHDGPSALEAAARVHPEVALLDIGLPLMDGYELARRLRQQEDDRLQLIAITGYGQDSDRARTRALGFAHHFVKPVDLQTLLASLGP
jgi:signal transduction histidine kinase